MWAEGGVAADTAAPEASLPKGASLQSGCKWYRRFLSRRPQGSFASRLRLLLALACLLQHLPCTDHRISTILSCVATEPERAVLEGFRSPAASSSTQESKAQLPPESERAFAELAAALRRSGSPAPMPASPHAETHLLPPTPVDGRQRHDSDYRDNIREEERPPASGQVVTRAARDFIYAMNSLLSNAKWEVASPERKGPTTSATDGYSNVGMGWSLRSTASEQWNARDANSVRRNDVLAERPAWLLPEHRPSVLTRKYIAPHESGTCPAVGGFGHPIGREFDGLENWDELLCRSGGVLRKINSPDLTYDTLVLVKGYRAGNAPVDESSTAAGDDLSSSAESTSIDSLPGRLREKGGLSFSSNRSRSSHVRGETSEAQQKHGTQPKETGSKNSRPRNRKTEAELENELNEVVDLLSMMHCHLANVVDLRHPSNFQLYANIRRVALLRSRVPRQRKQASSQFSTQQDSAVGTPAKQEVRRHGSNTSRFTSKTFDLHDDFAEEGGVMRGQGVSTVTQFNGATYSPRDEENRDRRQQQSLQHAPALRARNPTISSTRRTYPPGREEQKDVKASGPSNEANATVFRGDSSASSPLVHSDGGEAGPEEANDADPVEEVEDGSGPVLVVVRSLSAPERLYFGAHEIREFLFSRLLQTAYEIQAYNEFKRSLFALAKQKRNTRLTRLMSGVDGDRGLLNGASSRQHPSSTQVHSIPALSSETAATGSEAEHASEDGWEDAVEDDVRSSNGEGSVNNKRQRRASLTEAVPFTEWISIRSTYAHGATPANQAVLLGVNHDTSRGGPGETGEIEPDATVPDAEKPWYTPAPQAAKREPFATEKEERPWWAPLGLRFDLYVSFAGITPDRVVVSPTASLLRLVSEPRMSSLVCVYNYDDPKTDIPPVLRANGLVGLPALVLGRRVTTGARNIERLLVSIVEYKPPVPYSLEQYAPRFLVTEPLFSEVLANAAVTPAPVASDRTRDFKHHYAVRRENAFQ